MQQAWRWFGPKDTVRLSDIRQAGATHVVTALHHIATGQPWQSNDIRQRQNEIAGATGGALEWSVVESLPVSEDIKSQSGSMREHIVAYRSSLEALAEAGIKVICYNFMPVLDWTRTDLRAPMSHGGTAMRFDLPTFAAFDLYVLERKGAEDEYDDATLDAARARFACMSDTEQAQLTQTIGAGLPGSADHWSLDELRNALRQYDGLSPDRLRQHHIDFLSEVVPTAERLGVRLCCHPDDPPFRLLGLPREMSTADDYAHVLNAVPDSAFGMTLCTGSLGARPDNDCVEIARKFAPRIHFAHLRNVTRDTETIPCSFFEDEHLSGQTDMVGVVRVLLEEEARRQSEGRSDWEIPMRPDHGQEILSDLTAGAQPGYPAVGRLKGLAELRGVIAGLGVEVA
ncbi:mannonate dehydratase [Ruegeria sp. HKCCD8929]|uniref:mannonate dehydratase n=1 Tax=Ruegeria sp. HKCCD8929 TaxID=2683006 RepID=UPI001488FA25